MMATHDDQDLLNVLTYDALLEVMSHLSVQELGRLSRVSMGAKAIADDDLVWRSRCRALEAGWAKVLRGNQTPVIESNDTWKDTYRIERKRLVGLSKYVGMWSEQWCDVNVQQSTLIETDGFNFYITYRKNKFTAKFLSFDDKGGLSFHLQGGDSGWSFKYTLKPTYDPLKPQDSVLQLSVFREHDSKLFTGVYTRS